MQKVPGIERVEVRLNQGLTVLDLKAENTVTLAALRQVIRNNGFTTPEARVVARGTVSETSQGLMIDVSGTRERFKLMRPDAQPAQFDQLRRRAGTGPVPDAEITGLVRWVSSGAQLTVTSVRVP